MLRGTLAWSAALVLGLSLFEATAMAQEESWSCAFYDGNEIDFEWGDFCDSPSSYPYNGRRRQHRNRRRNTPTAPYHNGDHHISCFENSADGDRCRAIAPHVPNDAFLASGHGLPGQMQETDTGEFIDNVADRVESGDYDSVLLHVCHAGEPCPTGPSVGQQLYNELHDRMEDQTPIVYAPNGPIGSFVDAYGNPQVHVVDGYLTALPPASAFTAYDAEHPNGRPATPEEILALYGEGAYFTPEPRGGYGTPPPNDSTAPRVTPPPTASPPPPMAPPAGP